MNLAGFRVVFGPVDARGVFSLINEVLSFSHRHHQRGAASMSSQKKARGLMKEGPLVQMLDHQRVQQAAADEDVYEVIIMDDSLRLAPP